MTACEAQMQNGIFMIFLCFFPFHFFKTFCAQSSYTSIPFVPQHLCWPSLFCIYAHQTGLAIINIIDIPKNSLKSSALVELG